MSENVICGHCAYGFDELGQEGVMVHCCRLKKSMKFEDSCEEGKEY